MRNLLIPALVVVANFVSLGIGYAVGGTELPFHNVNQGTKFDHVLDGDTVVIDGEAIKVRGSDAPELGPWAKCWAEALAAGHAKDALEEELRTRKYAITDRKVDVNGLISAIFVDVDGFELSDPMSVIGGAAATDGKWGWCDSKPSIVLDGAMPPHGPNLWWPANHMYDERAAD